MYVIIKLLMRIIFREINFHSFFYMATKIVQRLKFADLQYIHLKVICKVASSDLSQLSTWLIIERSHIVEHFSSPLFASCRHLVSR